MKLPTAIIPLPACRQESPKGDFGSLQIWNTISGEIDYLIIFQSCKSAPFRAGVAKL